MISTTDSSAFELWSMHFWYDPINDVVMMTFNNCVIRSAEDAIDFMKVVFIQIQRHKTPTDVLIPDFDACKNKVV
ncbi:MAG: hypothetical protein JW841_06605 [Deltaproteobacteria bacterium]|nr:hypothetical protein [Deltaproteobacteria bacterium]